MARRFPRGSALKYLRKIVQVRPVFCGRWLVLTIAENAALVEMGPFVAFGKTRDFSVDLFTSPHFSLPIRFGLI